MRIGYASDWTGAATQKLEIIDETISGKYVCRQVSFEVSRMDGSKYVVYGNTGLFLRDKGEIKVEEVS